MQASVPDGQDASDHCKRVVNDNSQITVECTNISMAELAKRLPSLAPAYIQDRPVVDLTGIPGAYDLKLQWVASEKPISKAVVLATLLTPSIFAGTIFDIVGTYDGTFINPSSLPTIPFQGVNFEVKFTFDPSGSSVVSGGPFFGISNVSYRLDGTTMFPNTGGTDEGDVVCVR